MPITKESSDRFATVNGVELHYNEAGDGPALLCFHGGGPGANAWDNTRFNIDALAEHFHVYLIDLPGFGESDKTATVPEAQTIDGYIAGLIVAFMDQFGIDSTHLYASSFSGPFALRFALDNPARTSKVVLQATSSIIGQPLMLSPAPSAGIKALLDFWDAPSREGMARMMEFFVPDPQLRTDELIERRYQSAMTPGHLEASRHFVDGSRLSHLEREVANIQADVLLLWGRQDWMVPVEGVLRVLSEIPGVRVHVWADAGHFVQYEKREEFNRLVIDFLTH